VCHVFSGTCNVELRRFDLEGAGTPYQEHGAHKKALERPMYKRSPMKERYPELK